MSIEKSFKYFIKIKKELLIFVFAAVSYCKFSHTCAEIGYVFSPLVIEILYFFIFRISASRVIPSISAAVV